MPWYIPLLIFVARISDVSIGTLRMILVISGHRIMAAVLGFFEVIIWVLAVGGAITYLTHATALLAYAGGFACGTLVGMTIERRMALGFRVVRVINPRGESSISDSLRERGYRVTQLEGQGMRGPVEIAFMVVRRKVLDKLLEQVRAVAPGAFVSVERAEKVNGQGFESSRLDRAAWRSRLTAIRK